MPSTQTIQIPGKVVVVVPPAAIEGDYSTYTEVYLTHTINGSAVTNALVHEDGSAIVIETSGNELETVDPTGVVTDSGYSLRANSFTPGYHSSATAVYSAGVDGTTATLVHIFKQNVHLQDITSSLIAVTACFFSPNGEWLLLEDGSSDTFELWQGS